MIDWIPCSDRLPAIPEQVEVTDGYEIRRGFIWDNFNGLPYFVLDNTEFLVIWWRPLKGSTIESNFGRHTIPTDYPEGGYE
jgi:hypothetical protein